MKLVIVESPAKCSKIESFLGKGYKCIASFGHIRQIANGLKSIDIDNKYKVTYKTLSKKSKYITALRKAIAKADEVILATDDDSSCLKYLDIGNPDRKPKRGFSGQMT